MTDEGATFFIGELAERTGVSRDAIRYYEARGVLPEAARSASGYRLYGPGDVDRIAFVGQAQDLGLTLEEITEVLTILDEGSEPCVHVRERLAARLAETRQRIRRLRRLEGRLEAALSTDRPREGGAPTCRCRIIEAAAPRGRRSGAGPP